ncbi:MAG: type II secretion system protein [Candidatus Taylorbacteria bacterium]
MLRSRKHNRGFTLIELLVCITIFIIMTSLLVAKYGNFNKSVLLTNAVYSTALAIRTAQNYGLSVKGAGASCGSGDSFQCAYGVAFSTTDSGKFALFLDANGNGIKEAVESDISTYTLKNGATISGACFTDVCTESGTAYISFKRPDPSAIICGGASSNIIVCDKTYAKITISATDGSKRSISVRSNGQISVDI